VDERQCSTLTRLPRLVAALRQVPDPRARRGRRYTWSLLLTLIVAGLASGHLTPSAIGQWAREHSDDLEPICGKRIPSEATLRRTVAQADAIVLEEQLADFAQHMQAALVRMQGHGADQRNWQARALDGKAVRGAGTHGVHVHLVSEVTHQAGLVLQQHVVEDRSNEIPCVQRLLRGRSLHGLVFTLDALHTQRATARLIVEQQGHYLMIVKANQPDLHEALTTWFAEDAWVEAEQVERVSTVSKGHGRHEWRTLERRTAPQLGLLWPGAQQALRRHCLSVASATGQRREHVRYALTSLPASQASAAQLEQLWRGHWSIENRVHYVRDVTWREDAGQARAGSTPQVLAALRNGLLTLLRLLGHTNIAAALRHYGASVQRALCLVGALP